MFRHSLKMALRRLGIDVRRMKNVPSATFLGLRKSRIDCILDVGANVGQFARYAHELFPSARIFCFEPLSSAAAELGKWAATLPNGNVSVHEIALGERAGVAELIEHVDHSASSSFLRNTPRAERLFPETARQVIRQVPVETLDAWIEAHELTVDARSLLKLDVQGGECQVLRGARRALSSIGACMVEVTPIPLYENQSTFMEIVALLGEAGLQYLGNLEQFHGEDGLPLYMDAIFVRPSALEAFTRS